MTIPDHNNVSMRPLTQRLIQLLTHRVPTLSGPQEIQSLIINFTKGIFFTHLFIEHIASIKETSGPSMLPTLSAHGDWVYICKLYRRGKGVQVGDVISVKHPMFPGIGASKRIIGMPGDFVLRNSPEAGSEMMIQVPEGHCWLAGDNLPFSRDSREYGPLPLALIKGKVVAKIWPLSEAKWIENTFQPVHDTG